ncbi:putative EG45-like domain containing protein 1 [Eucalyptus grandis]|uniref:putative EG45-like domain containing protein 1 n=1 Tax=Eucalyptus grandis TaxID=71139 RepID=UPI000527AD73|nr:putative EG45-like domain containing protein 1 [Eucalyptus grandis]
MIAAVSDTFWAGGATCGSTYRVTCIGAAYSGIQDPCTGRSVDVRIVDQCPGRCADTIDLSKEAFETVADPVAGIAFMKLYEDDEHPATKTCRSSYSNLANQWRS